MLYKEILMWMSTLYPIYKICKNHFNGPTTVFVLTISIMCWVSWLNGAKSAQVTTVKAIIHNY